MARRKGPILVLLFGLGVSAATLAAVRAPDRFEEVKTAIRLKNFADAAARLQRMADTGDAEAQYQLAAFYLNGLNGPLDIPRARTYLEKAANQGHARAAFSLANLLAASEIKGLDD